jgi:hypothetical protein
LTQARKEEVVAETNPADPNEVAAEAVAEGGEEHPRGTMLLMLLYLIVIIAMWGYIYVVMVQRG